MIQHEKELRAYFIRRDNIVLLYLFGSTARGDATRLSDIDIAVLLDENLSKKAQYLINSKYHE